MRKTYQSPKCETFKIEVQHLLAGSENIPEGTKFQKEDAVLSRGGGNWNDDEE